MKPITRHGTGQAGEYLVAAELAREGFTVALPTGNAEAIDILAYGYGQSFAIQVKAVGRGDHQFNLGKFLEIKHEEDERQTIVGPLADLDAKIIVVFVFLGERAGQDKFAWAWLNEFADLLAVVHGRYLARNGGRRPRNPKSLDLSLSQDEIEKNFAHSSLSSLLGLAKS